ncbi:MAG: hypothetical protein AAGM16_03240 [Pseudomonadota bacterium]
MNPRARELSPASEKLAEQYRELLKSAVGDGCKPIDYYVALGDHLLILCQTLFDKRAGIALLSALATVLETSAEVSNEQQ